ncbi:MAG TPA: carboxypeptidase M32, partial [Candidatus Levybacteria bacterium]|nr:carboxypeptidase M32 [Candidatus Levybacteria bacterium]
MGNRDIRITTAYTGNDFRDSLMASIHEGGHALYEQGINPEYADTPLGGGVSLGIHESQSRFWENQIGRHPEFIKFVTPLLHAFFPALENADSDAMTMLMNHVKPGNIRIEADEVTYNLHIVIRFEIEHALINEKIKPENLPEVWREKMKKYLGVTPPTDSQGVLQDVHWSYGSFGYFPTYTLGNLYAAQISNMLKKEVSYEKDLSTGNVREVLAWLRSNIHTHGSVYTPEQLIK